MYKNWSELVEAVGRKLLATEIKVTEPTIRYWCKKNRVKCKNFKKIQDALKKNGIKISLEEMHALNRSKNNK